MSYILEEYCEYLYSALSAWKILESPGKVWKIPEISGNPWNMPESNQAPFGSSPIKGALTKAMLRMLSKSRPMPAADQNKNHSRSGRGDAPETCHGAWACQGPTKFRCWHVCQIWYLRVWSNIYFHNMIYTFLMCYILPEYGEYLNSALSAWKIPESPGSV